MIQRLHLGLRRAVNEGTLTKEQYHRVMELSHEKNSSWQSWAALLLGGFFVIVTLVLQAKNLWWAFGPVTRTVLVAVSSLFFWRGTLWFHRRATTAASTICSVATVLTVPLTVHFLWLLLSPGGKVQPALGSLYILFFDRPDLHGFVISLAAAAVAFALLVVTSQPLMALACGIASWQAALALCFMTGLVTWHTAWIATAVMGVAYLLKGWLAASFLRSRPHLAPLWIETGVSMTLLLGGFLLWSALFSRLFERQSPLMMMGYLLFNGLFAFWGASVKSLFLTLMGAAGTLWALQRVLTLYLSDQASAWITVLLGGLLVAWGVWNLRARKSS